MTKKNLQFIYCSFVPVGLEDYVEYFKANFKNFVYLKWRFPHNKGKVSTISTHKNGKLGYEAKIYALPVFSNKLLYFLFLPLNHFIYLVQAIGYLWTRPANTTRVFMGINYYCAFCGIILKKLGRVDYVIYRVMDFFPLPKSGIYRTLNKLFYVFDKFCLKNADSIWFTTEGHIAGREKYGYFDRTKANYQMIPLAVKLDKFVSTKVTNHDIIYCGIISKYHMMDMVFEVIEKLTKDFPDVKLKIIGSGPDEDYFKKLASDKKMEKNVIFYGFVDEGPKFNELMSNSALGIALYKDEENFMKYTEPAKVKYYLNFGVPVIVSDVPKIARELDKLKVAYCVKNNANDIAKTIKSYFNNSAMQNEYKKNIEKFIKTIDVNYLLEKNFNETFAKFKIDWRKNDR
jgi:glycosyltransferase involved in cell wall biosynthesis